MVFTLFIGERQDIIRDSRQRVNNEQRERSKRSTRIKDKGNYRGWKQKCSKYYGI